MAEQTAEASTWALRSESRALPVLRYFSPGLVCVMKKLPRGPSLRLSVEEYACGWLCYSSPRLRYCHKHLEKQAKRKPAAWGKGWCLSGISTRGTMCSSSDGEVFHTSWEPCEFSTS